MGQVSPFNTVVLDGSGNGQCAIGPPTGAVWLLNLATLSVAPAATQPQGFLYRGSAQGPIELIDTTYTGAQASSGKVGGAPYFSGQLLWAVWAGGTPGATATLRAYGAQAPREAYPFEIAGGEGFDNPIVAGTSLIIPAINSPNYVAGAAGWTINRDGSAEFNNATVRGDLVVGPNPGAHYEITGVIPAELTTFYSTHYGDTVVEATLAWRNATDYYYDIALSGASQSHARGIVISGTVKEFEYTVFNVAPAGVIGQYGEITTTTVRIGPFGTFQMAAGAGLDLPGRIYVDTLTCGTGTTNITQAALAAAQIRSLVFRFQAPAAGSGGVAASGGGANIAMAGGGGAGGYMSAFVDVADTSGTIVVVVGTAGAAGAAGNNPGGTAGASSITDSGALSLTAAAATGGGGGAGSGAAGFGGTGGSGGSISVSGASVLAEVGGSDGQSAIRQAGFYGQQGFGGSSHMAGLTRASTSVAGSAGNNGRGFGGGAAGAQDGSGNTARAGGVGGDGRVWVDRYR